MGTAAGDTCAGLIKAALHALHTLFVQRFDVRADHTVLRLGAFLSRIFELKRSAMSRRAVDLAAYLVVSLLSLSQFMTTFTLLHKTHVVSKRHCQHV